MGDSEAIPYPLSLETGRFLKREFPDFIDSEGLCRLRVYRLPSQLYNWAKKKSPGEHPIYTILDATGLAQLYGIQRVTFMTLDFIEKRHEVFNEFCLAKFGKLPAEMSHSEFCSLKSTHFWQIALPPHIRVQPSALYNWHARFAPEGMHPLFYMLSDLGHAKNANISPFEFDAPGKMPNRGKRTHYGTNGCIPSILSSAIMKKFSRTELEITRGEMLSLVGRGFTKIKLPNGSEKATHNLYHWCHSNKGSLKEKLGITDEVHTSYLLFRLAPFAGNGQSYAEHFGITNADCVQQGVENKQNMWGRKKQPNERLDECSPKEKSAFPRRCRNTRAAKAMASPSLVLMKH